MELRECVKNQESALLQCLRENLRIPSVQGEPEEGAPYDYDTALLINRSEEPSAFVLEVMQAITSEEGNAVFNNYNIAVLENGADRGDYPDDFKLMDMSGIADTELKARLSAEWSARYE